MDNSKLETIFSKIKDARIAVYGDFCLDVYWIMDKDGSEVSVETGLKAEAVLKQKYSPGGAGNIVANLSALRPKEIRAIGVVGNDIFGRELKAQLNSLGVVTESLIKQNENFATYTYLKKYNDDQEDPRIDFGLKNKRSIETDTEVIGNLRNALENYDVLIFNQQVEGSLNNDMFIDAANALFEKYDDKIVILDSRHYNRKFKNVYRKTNEIEAAVLIGKEAIPSDFIPLEIIREDAFKLHQQTTKPVFVTSGPRGIIIADKEGLQEVPALRITGKIDTVGAGDTVISALAVCLAADISHIDSASFATLAAGVTIQKLFTTGTASKEEIKEINNDPDYNYQEDLANDVRLANYFENSEIELCEPSAMSRLGNFKHLVFDHDGTVSTLREGWEEVMEPVMVEAILGDTYKTANKSVFDEAQKSVKEFIDVTTGIQTIVQMEGLVKLVDEFNIVPKDQIKDKFEYKKIYNDALMEVVNKRTKKLETGQLLEQDYMMKGVLEFLTRLKDMGMKLYLASGTDKDDVITEAKALGYADMFDGGIYGSVGDVSKYSKKMVIDDIIKGNSLKGEELLTIGDGPVEIKECRKANGITIGVASDEIRRFGLNTDKRKRLIKAGAHFIIPDFSQTDILFNLLYNK
ncbi:MAG: PfkB family carbohydrate kinase [Bacteroidota bacterium]